MSAFVWLNVGIGLVSIYLVTAISCTAATETISSLLGLRWKMLKAGISNLFNDKEAVRQFYDNPLIRPLFHGRTHPTSIPAARFSGYVFEQIFPSTKPDDIVTAQEIVEKAQISEALKGSLIAILGTAENRLEVFRANVETWFDASMESVSEWYKNRTKIISLVAALVIAGLGNVDTIAISRFLSSNSEASAAFATAAVDIIEASGGDLGKLTEDQRNTLVSLESEYKLPLGWEGNMPASPYDWVLRVLGILLTGFAVSLGAPFWFDILSRIGELRRQEKAAGPTPGTATVAMETPAKSYDLVQRP